MLLVTFVYVPLDLPARHAAHQFHLYQLGSLFCFILAAVLLVFFVVRLDRNRRESGKALEAMRRRSEEHTSELQSLMRISYAVFCLKKKKIEMKRSYTT